MTVDYKRAPWWPTAIDLELGLARRPQPSVPHMTRPMWTDALDELVRVRDWVLWNHAKRKGPRPNVWKRAPLYAKDALARYEKAHPKPPKPGPAPQPHPVAQVWWPGAPWHRKILYTTWGFTSGQFTPEALVARAAPIFKGGIALEGYPADGTSTDGHDNTRFVKPLRDACHNADLPFLVWDRTDQMTVDQVLAQIRDWQPDAYLADVEVDWNRPENTTIPAAVAKSFPTMPRAVIIAGMPDAKYCAPWIAARFDCCTQAYERDKGPIVGGVDRDAYWRGWPPWKVLDASKPAEEGCLHTFPCLEAGAEGAPPLRPQLPNVAAWGDSWSVYCAELMSDDDWAVLGG